MLMSVQVAAVWYSARHIAEQPSPSAVLVSSHCSLPVTAPAPHTVSAVSIVHVAVQPSPLAVLPSSHCSPLSRKPSPHTGALLLELVQAARNRIAHRPVFMSPPGRGSYQ